MTVIGGVFPKLRLWEQNGWKDCDGRPLPLEPAHIRAPSWAERESRDQARSGFQSWTRLAEGTGAELG